MAVSQQEYHQQPQEEDLQKFIPCVKAILLILK